MICRLIDQRALLFLGLLSAACDRSGPSIEIIVPERFTGPIWIVEDPQRGKAIPRVNGRFEVKVPSSGILTVSSIQPFQRWHSGTARYADGTALQRDGLDSPMDDAVALRAGGYAISSRHGREVRYLSYYVGSKMAAKGFLERSSPPQ
jgi:hypothetical protein